MDQLTPTTGKHQMPLLSAANKRLSKEDEASTRFLVDVDFRVSSLIKGVYLLNKHARNGTVFIV